MPAVPAGMRWNAMSSCADGPSAETVRVGGSVLALLQQRGMAAWARASQPLPPAPVRCDGRDGGDAVAAGVDAAGVVGVLAGMAAACVLGG